MIPLPEIMESLCLFLKVQTDLKSFGEFAKVSKGLHPTLQRANIPTSCCSLAFYCHLQQTGGVRIPFRTAASSQRTMIVYIHVLEFALQTQPSQDNA